MIAVRDVYLHVRSVKWYSRWLTILLGLLLIALPVSLFLSFTGWRSYDPIWEEVLWQSSLQNGSFWLLPGHVIFQDDTYLGGEGEAVMATVVLFIVFLIPVAIAIALSYRSLAYVLKAIIVKRRSPDMTKAVVSPKESLVRQLLPDLRDERALDFHDYSIALTGRSLVIQTAVSHTKLPPLFFDSVTNDIARREGRRFVFRREEELVLDGTTFEHFRIYAHNRHHAELTRFLTTDVLAIIVKQLDKAEIILENNTLTTVVDIRTIKTEKDIDLLIQSIKRLRVLFEKADTQSVQAVGPELASVDNTIRLFGLVVVKKIWAQAIMWMAVGLYVTTAVAANGRGLTGDLLLPVWLAGSFQLIGIHRTLKHRISLRLKQGIFTSDWGRKMLAMTGGSR